MSLNLHIRELREARALRISDLAEMVGVSTPHMSGVERGKKNLNNHLIERIATALNVPPETLFSGTTSDRIAKINALLTCLPETDQDRVRAFAEGLRLSQEGSQPKQ
jgi:transcriptional regulator with XRE-family HTH domain